MSDATQEEHGDDAQAHDAKADDSHGSDADDKQQGDSDEVRAGSLSLLGTVSLGTGVMISAGIFAILGQVAGLAGGLFPLAFLVGAVVVGFSAYSYVKLANAFPSSGGIAMFLRKEYGPGTATGVFSLLMFVSMVINESLVARTFGSYTLQVVPLEPVAFWAPALGVALLVGAFAVNAAGNETVQRTASATAFIKIAGLTVFAAAGLWLASWADVLGSSTDTGSSVQAGGFLAGVALAILAYKGFTTITNSGGEVVDPHRNIGRAIVISISICAALYLALAVAVAGNLSLPEIVAAQNYALAEAARPAFGDVGVWFTVALAIVATVSGVIASVFATSRMLAMLTRMKQVPRAKFRMPGGLRTQAMIFTVGIAIVLTIVFDLSRIAALGAIFYLIMDIAIHWGILRRLQSEIGANTAIVVIAIVLDLVVLGALLWINATTDALVLYVSAAGLVAIVVGERLLMRSHTDEEGHMHMEMDE